LISDFSLFLKLLFQASENVENEDSDVDGGTQVSQGVGHHLQLAAVVMDGEVTMDEGAEDCVGLEGVGLMILEGKPEVPRRTIVLPSIWGSSGEMVPRSSRRRCCPSDPSITRCLTGGQTRCGR
jgi:hypothetical protein